MKSKQELYRFCIENIANLINGDLSIDKIEKLREIKFDFNYYIDDYLEIIKQGEQNES